MVVRFFLLFIYLRAVCAVIDLTPESVTALTASHAQDGFFAQISSLFESDQFTSGNSLHGMLVQTSSFSSSGFLQQTVYTKADGTEDLLCLSSTYTASYAANSCFTTKKFAFIIRLADNTGSLCNNAIVQYFSDASCQRYIGFSELFGKANLCQAMTSDTGRASKGRQKFQCTLSASPSLSTNSVTNGLYSGASCNGDAFGYINFAPNKCSKMKVTGSTVFVKYDCQQDEPGFSVYSDNKCTSAEVSRTPLSTSCSNDRTPRNHLLEPAHSSSSSSMDDDDDLYTPPFLTRPSVSSTPMPQVTGSARTSNNFYCSARAPTRMPVFVPSAFPTQRAATAVSFSVRQILRGIDAATFSARPINAQVLIQTIADTMSGISIADIQGLSVSDAARRRLRAQHSYLQSFVRLQGSDDSHRVLQADSAVNIAYVVDTNSIYSASQLQNELNSALTSGAFTSALNSNAENAGATDMTGTSSNAISPPPSDAGLSHEAVAGIIIGCAVFVVMLIFMCIYCCCCAGKAPEPSPTYAIAAATAPPDCTTLVVAPSTAVVVHQSRAVVVAREVDNKV